MNGLLKCVMVFLAATLAAFALPASAGPDKIYSLNVTGSVPAGTTTSGFTATFKNETPSGNSSINSLTLSVAGGGLSIVGASVPNGVVSPIPSVASPKTTINVTNMSPVKNGKTFTVTLTVKADPAAGCGNVAATWSATTWTGSSLSGENFALQPFPLSNVNTNVTTGCTVSFVTQPKDALSMGVVGGPAKVQVSPAATFEGTSVTLGFDDSSPGGATFAAGTNVATVSGGFAEFPNLSITGPAGTYKLSASTAVAGGPTATSAAFKLLASDGELTCDGVPVTDKSSAFGGTNGYSTLSGNRGGNKDGSVCKLVAYDLEFLGPREVVFVWDTTNQPGASFAYRIDWAPELVDSITGLPKNTKVAWTVNGVTPNYVVGRACVSPNLPTPYGSLSAAIGATDTTIGISPSSTPAVPFPIVIGNERMTVTGVGTGSWTVTRGVGGTTATTHVSGAPVMSTPFPLDGSGNVMQMCIQDELFVTLPASSCTPTNGNASCVGVSTTIFDGGDGFVNRDL